MKRSTVRVAAPACAAVLTVWNNVALPSFGFGPRGRAAANTAFALALAGAARAGGVSATELGWRAPGRGLLWGAAAAVVPAAVYPVMVAIPQLRERMATGARRADRAEWVFVHIPFGTVLAEELAFRSVLYALLQRDRHALLQRDRARVFGALAFGLWHVVPARHAGDSIAGTVALTALSGAVFDELRRRSGSVVAPALLHLAVNVGGAIAAGVAARPVRHG